MDSKLQHSLKEYLISQSVEKNHYPFKYWIRNKNFFINLVFWSWFLWALWTFFSIFLPIANQQRLGRGAIVVFEAVFQYMVKVLNPSKQSWDSGGNTVSGPIWNYETYLYIFFTVSLLALSFYCFHLVRNFLYDLNQIIKVHPLSKHTKFKFVFFHRWFKYFLFAYVLCMAWTLFCLVYVRRLSDLRAFSFMWKIEDFNAPSSTKIYTRELTTTGWVTSGLNILFALVTIVLYLKYSRELFIGNHFFLKDFRIRTAPLESLNVDPKISKKILESNSLSRNRNYRVANDPGYIAQLSGVNKYFRVGNGYFHALKNINLEIKEGELVVILGYSGSGKTTLLNILAGIDKPTDGKCIISDHDITQMNDYDLNLFRRRKIGYIFQNYALLPNLTAAENIEIVQGMNPRLFRESLGDCLKEMKGNKEKGKGAQLLRQLMRNTFLGKPKGYELDEILNTLDLTDHRDKYPNTLSGGQQQRVSVARALSKKPKILLADEPTAAIDHEMAKSILNLFYEINKYTKTTVILITHNPLIAKMARRILHVEGGEIVRDIKNLNPVPPHEIKGL